MKENHIGKIKSMLVAIIMLLSVMFVFGVVNITANTETYDGISGLIVITSPINGSYVSGVVNITWDNTTLEAHGGNPTSFNVTFSRYQGAGSGWDGDGSGNASANGGNATWYLWNTTTNNVPDGVWYVNVTATTTYNGSITWINATSVKLVVRNSLPGTPGVDLFQGGRYGIAGITGRVLETEQIDFEVGVEYNINVYTGANWADGTDYYLYQPIYNGSDTDPDNTAYSLIWKRTDESFKGNQYVGYEISEYTFDSAGLWLIDENAGDWANASFRTIETYNSSVDAWFWVNTSTTYKLNEVNSLPTSFVYNSSGYLTLEFRDENGDPTPHDQKKPVVDIRRDDNGSSIYASNRQVTDSSWDYSLFYKNNSYNGFSFPGEYGFLAVGNYTIYAYYDFDRAKDISDWASSAGNYVGVQRYSENNMGSSANGVVHYNTSYGANADQNKSDSWLSTATKYNWSTCGPWDPPEHNVTEQHIQVTTNEPHTSVASGNSTMYWGFDGEVNITFGKTSVGTAFAPSDVNIWIFDDDGINVSRHFIIFESTDGGDSLGTIRSYATGGESRPGRITIHNDAYRDGYIQINMTTWGKNNTNDSAFGDNGTWTAQIYIDYNGDRDLNGENKEWSEEWNTTVEWTVAAGPAAQFKWIDDDGDVGGVDLWGFEKSNNDGVIPYVPTATNVPLDVEFYVYGEDGSYFGDVASGLQSGKCRILTECAENITITGNSLFTGKLSDFPGYGLSSGSNCGYSSGVWSVPIVPTMSLGGGEITIKVTAFNSSVSEKISIGGENYEANGSIVSVTPNDFMIDQENKTLTITVKNSETGVENPYVSVYLYYLDDGTKTPAETMKPITAHNVSRVEAVGGVYTISFNTTQQTTNQTEAGFGDIKAPRNLTIYVSGPGNREGYALIQMKPVNDLETHISVETFMAGRDYDDVVISCDFVNGTEGKADTDTPSTKTADKNTFHMKIVDKDGDDVTGTSTSNGVLRKFYNTVLTGSYSVEKDNVYGIDAGTYSIYAWNNTHNSEGHNATFEIKAVEVTCDKAPFIWSVDANISATFTITYNGNPANGTLRIDNMSDKGAYNRTWTNCSFDGVSSHPGGNTSLLISKTKITNGVVTVHDISADVLHPNVAKQYITFWFKPTESGSVYAKAAARMNVEVPSVTPDPEYIPLGRTTKVYCTATGRGETLQDVFIRLHGQGFDQNSTTDVDGRVAFSVTPASTGNISIDVGEVGRTLADTVVYVVAWVIDVDVVAEINEGGQFTVTVTKEGTTDVVVGATVTIKGVGTNTTDSSGQVTFTAPDVTSDRTYTIKVTATGYAPDPDTNTITVINIPKLIIVIPDSVKATTTFEVAVADDTGGAIVGAIITFNEKTYTTGVNGIAKLTAPKTKEDYPIKATFGNYVAATGTVTVTAAPGIPGFELLALIAALGVAFILFRRRRRR